MSDKLTELIKWMEGAKKNFSQLEIIEVLNACIAQAHALKLQAEPERKGIDINQFLEAFEKSDAHQETVAKMQGKVKWAVVHAPSQIFDSEDNAISARGDIQNKYYTIVKIIEP